MVAKLIFGIVLPVFGLGYSEFSLSDTCSLDSLDGQGVYECFKKKSKDADMALNEAYGELNEKVSADYKVDPILGHKLESHIKSHSERGCCLGTRIARLKAL